MFTDGDGNKVVEDLATEKFKKYAKEAGLPCNVRSHSTRHNLPTIAANHGTKRNILKAILGYSSMKTTEGYMGADADTMREEMKQVSLAFQVSNGSGSGLEGSPRLAGGS
jgi:site-specific recombinase XerD